MKIHGVIMAGGRGTRFWPESRTKRPKQLIALTGPKALLEETIERILPICSASNIHIVTGKDIKDKVKKLISRHKGINLIAEPKGRNTAPCIGYMASRISYFSSPEDVMVVLPSDHMVKNRKKFVETILAGVEAASKHNTVVTIGITPSSPNTGYGYIQMGKKIKSIKEGINLHHVKSFKEKPNIETAKEFLESGEYLWNAGMFIVKAGVIFSEIKKHMPELHKGLLEIGKHFGKKDEWAVFDKKFAILPSESIDFGIIEKLSTTLTGKKLIALLDVNDLIIIDTDDVLLIADKKSDQKIKEIVEKLKEKKLDEYL
ncbi:MAG: mannose-1-phosphate guanylyltransferase [Proteobacteria bacterium]|nr:mannose-1-phosphate guanylyltransferase [Pseudomonadota bacterium]